MLANLVNNLPAYVAVEAAVPAGHADQLLALLIGTNAGPLVLPWGSLATVIWFERVRAAGVTGRAAPVRADRAGDRGADGDGGGRVLLLS